MLTLEQFNKLPHGEVFRVVVMKSNAATMERDEEGQLVPVETMFVCKKGTADDWAIYYMPFDRLRMSALNRELEELVERVKDYGNKLTLHGYIQEVVPVDEEVLKLYRL